MDRPLAAGFLTGKFINNEHAGTRFDDKNPLGNFAKKLFGAQDLHSAMKKFDVEVNSYNLTPIEVAIRWISHHSALKDDDGIIMGASKAEQIQGSFSMIKKGPLPAQVLKMAEDLWSAVKESRGEII
jgi:aflatoxin B1 aldehyde reductase